MKSTDLEQGQLRQGCNEMVMRHSLQIEEIQLPQMTAHTLAILTRLLLINPQPASSSSRNACRRAIG